MELRRSPSAPAIVERVAELFASAPPTCAR